MTEIINKKNHQNIDNKNKRNSALNEQSIPYLGLNQKSKQVQFNNEKLPRDMSYAQKNHLNIDFDRDFPVNWKDLAQDKKLIITLKSIRKFYEALHVSLLQEFGKPFSKIFGLLVEPETDKEINNTYYYFNMILRLTNFILTKNHEVNSELKLKKNDMKYVDDYELLLQRAEEKLNDHIKNENRLRLLLDGLTEKYNESQNIKSILLEDTYQAVQELKEDNRKLLEFMRDKDMEINELKNLIKKRDEKLKNQDYDLLSIPVLEHKIETIAKVQKKERLRLGYRFEELYKEELITVAKILEDCVNDLVDVRQNVYNVRDKLIILKNEIIFNIRQRNLKQMLEVESTKTMNDIKNVKIKRVASKDFNNNQQIQQSSYKNNEKQQMTKSGSTSLFTAQYKPIISKSSIINLRKSLISTQKQSLRRNVSNDKILQLKKS